MKKEGKGTYSFNNGDTYEGDFVNGMMEGEGIYTYSKTNSKYEGSFQNGKRHGKGIYYYANGNIFDGEFENGEMKYGTFTFLNDDKYEGEFANGKFEGKG